MAEKHNSKILSDPYTCYICGIKNNMDRKVKKKFRNIVECHHIVERNEGGLDTPENLLPVCSNCHSKIHEGMLKLDKWYYSTRGWIFHYYDESGKEVWGK